jgi:phosphoribosylanthranilate isomerase
MTGREAARVRVKICGITNREDAEAAIALGADALGFNLFAGSKRCISLSKEGEWIRALPPFVTRVAVLVNEPLHEARAIAEHPAIDLVQFHGDEDAAYCAAFARFGHPFIKALRLREPESIAHAARFSTTYLLVDAYADGAFGGAGRAVDLVLAAELAREQPTLTLILAGGLTPTNVGRAVRAVRPFAVDVASGVEMAPGRKARELMRAFIRRAHSAAAGT